MRIALYHLTESIHLTYTLLIAALGIGGIAGCIGRDGPLPCLAIAVVAGVDVIPDGAIRTSSTAVAHITVLPAALAYTVSSCLLAEAAALLCCPALFILVRLLPPTTLLAAVSAVLLLRFKLNSTWLVLGGAAVGFGLHALGLAR